MPACASCGAPLAPGATFCRACGEAIAPLGASAKGAPMFPGEKRPARPNKPAAVAIALLLATFYVALLTFQASRGFQPGIEEFVPMALVALPVGVIAYAVARGHAWAKWVALVALVLWGIFLAWMLPDPIRQLNEPFFPDARFRQSAIFSIGIAIEQIAVALVAIYLLLRARRAGN